MNLLLVLSHSAEVYEEILKSRRPADAVLSEYLRARKYLGSHDRKFISETVYGALREHLELEKLACSFLSEQGLPARLNTVFILVFFLLRKGQVDTDALLGAMQQKFAFKPETLYAAVIAASESKHLTDATNPSALSQRHAFPEWMTARLLRHFDIQELDALYHTLNTPAPLGLRVNTMKTSRAALQQILQREGIETEEGLLSPDALLCRKRYNVMQTDAFRQGLFEIQDEGSQVISLLLNPKSGEKILDACAGGGGKTLHLATLMKGRGRVFAHDKFEKRFGNIRLRIRRSGLQNIELIMPAMFEKFARTHCGKLDAVLIDAPCSGSGTLRRNPDLKHRLSEGLLMRLAQQQKDILSQYAPLVKTGGTVVYATCSLFREENEEVVEAFLQAHPSFTLVLPKAQLLNTAAGSSLSNLIAYLGEHSYLRLLPHQTNTDGFFAAVLMKN
ncbi:MAG: RsmB/NOP family class I SAM-dependent RNA methyltransferase [Chloroherpetonaceae bacterium]|nr:RsmB/NOP family class I SAM-dependent RNA methyltransferase [Chloroherpetonaceae bacterium]MDW8467497.1 RsmB/NOP family class I SAM-dependent RNA methyltransferase [Chloroherpetonaceae bacterium]